MNITLDVFFEKYQKKNIEFYPNTVTQKPLVSVCIQTYNHENYIKECLDGVINQKTNFDFEILLGEDESSDNTRAICIEYAKKYPDKIKLFLHRRENNIKVNNKPTGRFNYAYNLLSAKGKYIAICEGDDYWVDTNKLQKQFDFMEAKQDYGICFHETNVLFQDEETTKLNETSLLIPETSGVIELTDYNFIVTPSVFLRNDFNLPDWYFKLPIGDWTLYFIQLQGRKIKKLKDVMAVYRIHAAGTWSSSSLIKRHQIDTLTIRAILNNVSLPQKASIKLKTNLRLKKKALFKLKLKKFFYFKID